MCSFGMEGGKGGQGWEVGERFWRDIRNGLISRRASFGAGKKPSVKGCGADIRHLDPPESSDPHSKAGSQLSLATATRGPVQGLQGSVRGYPFEATPFSLADKVGRRGGR